MKTVPAHLLTDLASVEELDSYSLEAFANRDFRSVESLNNILKAFNSHYVSFLNSQSIDKELIAKNIFLRSIMENYSSGRNNIRILKSLYEVSIEEQEWERQYLYQLSLDLSSNLKTSKVDVSLKSLPKDWDRYFKLGNLNYTIGGVASDFPGWENTGLEKFPIKTLYIIDPYFMKDRNLAIKNLSKLLTGLLGKKNPFKEIEIALFVKKDNNDTSFQKTKMENFQELNKTLLNDFPGKNFNSSILYIPESKMHDRHLLTNFYHLTAGKGFCIYNEKNKLDTQKSNNLDIKLLGDPKSFNAFYKKLIEIKNWIDSSRLTLEYSGELPNKLFSIL